MRCALTSGLCGLACVLAAQVSLAGAAPASGNSTSAPALAWPQPLRASQELPEVRVGPLTVRRSSAFDALRQLLAQSGTGIGLTYAGAALPETLLRPVEAANLEGRLPLLVEQLAQVAGFYYDYDAATRVLTVSGDREFRVRLPRNEAAAAAMVQHIHALGGSHLDRGLADQGLVYTADRGAERRIVGYLDAAWDKAPAAASVTPKPPELPGQRAKAASGLKASSGHPQKVRVSKATPAPVVHAVPLWQVKPGELISQTFERWARRAGWRVVWQAPELQTSVGATLAGSFQDAVMSVVQSLDQNGAALRPVFYAGNRVLRLTGEAQ